MGRKAKVNAVVAAVSAAWIGILGAARAEDRPAGVGKSAPLAEIRQERVQNLTLDLKPILERRGVKSCALSLEIDAMGIVCRTASRTGSVTMTWYIPPADLKGTRFAFGMHEGKPYLFYLPRLLGERVDTFDKAVKNGAKVEITEVQEALSVASGIPSFEELRQQIRQPIARVLDSTK